MTKAFKRGFSSYGDLLRVAFDNGLYGQNYASTESFSGLVTVYYNTLFSGTPKAMRRFYPDVEDSLVSRVCFVMLPDQFGKPMPMWGELKEKDMEEVMRPLERLDWVSIVDNTVQPDHVMDLTFLNRDLKKWLTDQMLTQHLLRFEIDGTGSNVNPWEEIFEQLPEEFTREELQQLLKSNDVSTSLRMVLYKWRLLGCVITTEFAPRQKALRFKKCA